MIDVNKWIDKNGSFDEAGGYRYDDRTNPIKAREMFEIYQSHLYPCSDYDEIA